MSCKVSRSQYSILHANSFSSHKQKQAKDSVSYKMMSQETARTLDLHKSAKINTLLLILLYIATQKNSTTQFKRQANGKM